MKVFNTDERVKRIVSNPSAVEIVRNFLANRRNMDLPVMGSLKTEMSQPVSNIPPINPDLAPEMYNMVPLMYDIPVVTNTYPPSDMPVDLFSDEAKARRRLKQAYAESHFNRNAQSKKGARGLFQIMPITEKDYLGRGRGKSGDIWNEDYNGGIRDWVMKIIPRDLQEFWSEDDSDRAKLAKLYAAYNWGAGNLRSFLRKKRDAGVDIGNPDNWVDDLNPETRRYVKYLAFDEDIPDSTVYTNAAFEKAAAERGYANGGRLFEDGGPEKTYQDYLDEYNAARSARASAMRDEDNAVKALREYQMNYRNPRGYWYWTDEGKKLDAAVDVARGKLAEARKNFDSAEKMIGEKTLGKYAGTANDPMYFWDYVADTKDKAEKYYKDRAIRESAGAKEVADYFNSYANSPGYQRIRENQRQWWVNRHPYRKIWQMGTGTAMESTDWLQDKLAGLSPAGVFDISTYPDLSVMRSGNGHGAITVGTFDSKEFPYWFTLPHEMAHISNAGGYATSTISAQKEALDQNVNTEPGHDSRPSEKHSDKEALMFMLYKEGIYDSRGEKDCTPEDIAKLRKKYPDLRPLQQMDDEKAAWMINHVADAGEQESLYGNHLGNISAYGGNLFRTGGPEKQNWFTRMMLNSVMNDPYTGAVATASGWTRDKEGNVTQTEEAANSDGAKRLRSALAEIAAMPLADLAVDVAGAAVVGTKTYKSIKLARELNKMLKAGEFDAAVDMAREASKAEPIVKASTALPAGYPSSSDYSLTRVPAGLPAAEQPVNLVSLPDYAGQVRDAVKAGKWGNLRFYRNIDGVPYTTDSGLIRLGKDENALVNVTSDLPFRLHGNYKAAPGAEYLVIDPEAFVGKTPLSIEPMDTFFPNVGMDIDPKYVKIITGNKGIIPEIEAKGMEALTSPELQELYSKIGGDFGSEAATAYRDAVDRYITENIGRPSLADYAHLEEVTGLKSGTVPLSEQEVYNAAKKASKEVEDTYDWMSKMGLDSGKYVRGLSGDIRWPYTYANGRDVSAISFSKEPIIGTGGKVFYDTAPPVEAGLMESLGSYSHPNIDRLNSILEFSLDPSGYHYFDPQIGKVGFIMPSPIRASGGKIHIKPENRGKFTALKERTGHSASWFKEHGTPAQKKMAVFALNSRKWGNRKDEGGENLIAEYPEGYNGELRQGKSFNAWDRYLANHPMVGHRLRKAKTLLLDAARVHPLTSFATDVYDSYAGPQDESDKITTPLGVVSRGGDIILNTVKQAGEIEPNMKKVFGRSAFGRLVSLPDFIDDSLKFVRDFAEPVTSFEDGGPYSVIPLDGEIEREPDNFTVRDNTYVSSLIPRGFGFNPAEERSLPPSLGQARWDDGITGAFPFIGDGLQGLQAIRDFRQGDPVTGFQTAGLLLIPNIAEKAVRGLFRKSTALSALDDVASGPPQTLLEKMRALRERTDAERVLSGDIPHPTRTVLSPEELGVEKDIPQEVKERFYSSSMERMRRQRPETNAKELGHKFGDVTNRTYREYPQSTFDKAGAGHSVGRHYDNGHIAVNENSKDVDRTLGHELRHELDWQVPLTENEKSILTDAYGDDFINTGRSGKNPKILKREEVTTNFDARNVLLGDKVSLSVDEQNALIDAATPQEIGTAVYKANGYGSSFMKKLVDEKKWTTARVKKIKEAMKTVGAVSGAAAVSRALYNDENLPVQLSDGGLIDRYSPEQIRAAIAKLKETKK